MTTIKGNIITREIVLSSGRTIILNDQQSAALDKMQEWLFDSKDLFFTLSGFAGTGKTTITKELIRLYHEKYTYNNIAVSAPTHKAKKVIQRTTEENSFTIQKLLGLRPNTDLENFDINNPQFDEKARKEIESYRFLIIDEASMLNKDLFDLIIKEATNWNVKVLFMGDEAQLPPVKESISKIFTEVSQRVQLTKVERQSDSNPIMKVYDLIRSDLKTPKDLFSHESATNGTGEGIVFYDDLVLFSETILPLFNSEDYKADSDFIKLITYTNDSVKAWNKKIRDYIYSFPESPIMKGEILFAYNTIYAEMDEILIENSSDYKVESVQQGRRTSWNIDCYHVVMKSVDEGKRSRANIVHDKGIQAFRAEAERLINNAKSADFNQKKFKWKEFYKFKAQHLLLNDVTDSRGNLLVKKDIDYGYAITTHKSQGSTFTNVAVSENNLDRNQNHEERNKLKYVAFSRPTYRAYVLTNKK